MGRYLVQPSSASETGLKGSGGLANSARISAHRAPVSSTNLHSRDDKLLQYQSSRLLQNSQNQGQKSHSTDKGGLLQQAAFVDAGYDQADCVPASSRRSIRTSVLRSARSHWKVWVSRCRPPAASAQYSAAGTAFCRPPAPCGSSLSCGRWGSQQDTRRQAAGFWCPCHRTAPFGIFTPVHLLLKTCLQPPSKPVRALWHHHAHFKPRRTDTGGHGAGTFQRSPVPYSWRWRFKKAVAKRQRSSRSPQLVTEQAWDARLAGGNAL